MEVLSHLEPKRVFYYFEQICNIPHGSGNIEAISNYLVEFAKENHLEYMQDEWNNVIIIKEATPGFEHKTGIILQGHMDMVAVQTSSSTIDMGKEGLQLEVEGDFVYAKETSLGGDDGIAVAYALALLESNEYVHPRLECVFTIDEETGMDGARNIDLSMLQGRELINIDSEEEGFLLTSCAGGGRVKTGLSGTLESMTGSCYEVTLTGLKGGHSGVKIHKGRGNANYLLMRFLFELTDDFSIGLYEIEGGSKDNVISKECRAIICINDVEEDVFAKRCKAYEMDLCKEYAQIEDDIQVLCKKKDYGTYQVLVGSEYKKVCALILNQPNGVQSMSGTIEGLVETSLNLGVLHLNRGVLRAQYSVRSSVSSAKEYLMKQMSLLVEQLGGTVTVDGLYPAWEYKEVSPLREKMQKVYRELYGKEMVVQAIHAGLECGLLAEKIPDLDCVSIGPDMEDIHTTKEKLSISSVERVWEYLLRVLAL